MVHRTGFLFFLFPFWWVFLSVRGEVPDTSVTLEGVRVVAPRYEEYRGMLRTVMLDTSLVLPGGGESVGELLERQLPLVMMRYGGAGSLTTLSLRGAPSSHTQVTWNGFPVNMLTSGVADLSQVASSLFERVTLTAGAPGSLYGSGTAGGAVSLDNLPRWQRGFSAAAHLGGGSFLSGEGSLTLAGGNDRMQHKMHLFARGARNDYPYPDELRPGSPLTPLEHNRYCYEGLVHNSFARLGRGWSWQGGLWLQKKRKELPAPMGSYQPSTQEQRDSSLRTFTSLAKLWAGARLAFRAAWFLENMRFTERSEPGAPEYRLDSRFRTSTLMAEAYYRYSGFRYLSLDAGVSGRHTTARVSQYGERRHEGVAEIFGGARYDRLRWRLDVTLRQTFREGTLPPPQAEAGILWRVRPRLLTLHAHLSGKYRLPTLNDRYWVPGGDPSLLPEHGWGAVAGHTLQLPRREDTPWQLSWKSDLFVTLLHDQIRWVPAEGLWKAENVEKMISRGAENTLRFSWTRPRRRLTASVTYHYTRATEQRADGPRYPSRYVPRHALSAILRADAGIFFTGTYFHYYSTRYTTTDGNPYYALPPYTLTDLIAGIRLPKKKTAWHLQAETHNLFNNHYEVIRSYPMPGRSFFLKLNILFGK